MHTCTVAQNKDRYFMLLSSRVTTMLLSSRVFSVNGAFQSCALFSLLDII